MLSQTAITELATTYQTTEFTVRREYCEHLFLSYLYRQAQAGNLLFKGGTALRIVYGSPRFSEDLDFSATRSDLSFVESVLIDTMQAIEREGVRLALEEATPTTGGYLAIVGFHIFEQHIRIKLEISFRKGEKSGETTPIINDFIPPYTLVQLAHDQLLGEKIQAATTRRKPRDFYDIYFILRGRLLSVEERPRLGAVLDALHARPDIRFDKELQEFLPRNHWPTLKNFRATLEAEIHRHRTLSFSMRATVSASSCLLKSLRLRGLRDVVMAQ